VHVTTSPFLDTPHRRENELAFAIADGAPTSIAVPALCPPRMLDISHDGDRPTKTSRHSPLTNTQRVHGQPDRTDPPHGSRGLVIITRAAQAHKQCRTMI